MVSCGEAAGSDPKGRSMTLPVSTTRNQASPPAGERHDAEPNNFLCPMRGNGCYDTAWCDASGVCKATR